MPTGSISHMSTVELCKPTAQEISHRVITAAMRVHTEPGPGRLESTDTACLRFELASEGTQSAVQVGLPVVYRGAKLELGYRIDLLVEDLVIVEIRSTPSIRPRSFRTSNSVANLLGSL